MREYLFRGFCLSPLGPQIIVVNGTEYKGFWQEGAYHKHQPVMSCPVQLGHSQPDEKYEHLIVYDSFADWNMPRLLQAASVIPETVSEFTGKYARNNVKIFEHCRLRDVGGTIGVVVWSSERCGFLVDFGEGFELQEINGDTYEVVGTIFDIDEQVKEADSKLVEIDHDDTKDNLSKSTNPCYGCCHYDDCGYFDPDLNTPDMTDKERFIVHCVGCCCGDGCECNRNNGGCMNYEPEPDMG